LLRTHSFVFFAVHTGGQGRERWEGERRDENGEARMEMEGGGGGRERKGDIG